MRNTGLNLILSTIFIFTGSFILNAQHEQKGHHSKSSEHISKHHLGVFNGGTTVLDHPHTGYSVGLDYEFRFSKAVGVGFMGEFIAMEENEYLLGIPFMFHPFKGSKIFTSPMVLIAEEHDEITHETHQDNSFTLRIGAGYDFHLGKVVLGPALDFDFGKENAIVYGFTIGFGV